MERKVILYIAMSLDGYIAGPGDDLDFLSMVAQEGQDYGYQEFTNTVDCVIIGRKSYDKVISMGFEYPHKDKEVYIFSRTQRPANGSFRYYTGDPAELVKMLKSSPGKHIYCDGGAEIANELLKQGLLDEMIISVIPVILGDGIKLFHNNQSVMGLQLQSCRSFEKGLVQLHYQCLSSL